MPRWNYDYLWYASVRWSCGDELGYQKVQKLEAETRAARDDGPMLPANEDSVSAMMYSRRDAERWMKRMVKRCTRLGIEVTSFDVQRGVNPYS